MNRYVKNFTTLTKKEQILLQDSKVCVLGCGGLGGYIIEMLARIGVRSITAVDGDVFEDSNLNRQILADENTLGMSKAMVAKSRMAIVNSEVDIIPIAEYIDESNAERILKGHHVVVDGLDNVPSRLILQAACENLKIPLVYGAIAGWYGQISTIFPGDRSLDKIYSEDMNKGIETELGNPSFTPALIASIQVGEVVKILIKRGDLLRRKVLFINTLEHDYEILDI